MPLKSILVFVAVAQKNYNENVGNFIMEPRSYMRDVMCVSEKKRRTALWYLIALKGDDTKV